MESIILRVQGTESHLPRDDVTIERLIAEARAVGLDEFAVLRNGIEVAGPDDLVVENDDIFVILPADYQDAEITVDISDEPAHEPANEPVNEPH